MQIGFIGLGIMGRPMGRHLLAGGHRLHILQTSSAADEMREEGAMLHATPRDIAVNAEAIVMMLPDTPDVEAMLFGPDGVRDGLAPGKLVIDMSSVSPIATRRFAELVERCGADWLDAPVSGGEMGAKTASLTIMVGGQPDSFARALPLFQLMGNNITHVGPAGCGQTTKVANQIIVALNIAAIGEALLFAFKAGADPKKVRAALMGGFAGSRVLEVHGQKMIDRLFNPGFRIDLHHKDLCLAIDGGSALGLALPQTALCLQLMNSARGAGEGGLDHAALIKSLERLAGVSLPEQPADAEG